MASIVPKNAAPVPGSATLNPQQRGRQYGYTDWGRLGGNAPGPWTTGMPGPIRRTYVDPVTGQTYETEDWPQGGQWQGQQAAIPPGFAEASQPSRYGVAWRGAGFGPSGRLSAPTQSPWPSSKPANPAPVNSPDFGPVTTLPPTTTPPPTGPIIWPTLPTLPPRPPDPNLGPVTTLPPTTTPPPTGPIVWPTLPTLPPRTGSTGGLPPVETYVPEAPKYTITNPWATTVPKTGSIYKAR